MPQEIEVWYVLPAIRRELAKTLVKKHKHSQKEVAEFLGVTEAAVSQYLKSKRGKELVFDKDIINEIEDSAGRLAKDKNGLMDEMKRICALSRMRILVCKLHRKHDKEIRQYCGECRG